MKINWFRLSILLFIIFGCLLSMFIGKQKKDQPLDISFEEFSTEWVAAQHKTQTTLEFANKYNGKRIIWTGVIQSVINTPPTINLEALNGERTMVCLDNLPIDDYLDLRKGDTISVEGQIIGPEIIEATHVTIAPNPAPLAVEFPQ